jgi:hypothetical protein
MKHADWCVAARVFMVDEVDMPVWEDQNTRTAVLAWWDDTTWNILKYQTHFIDELCVGSWRITCPLSGSIATVFPRSTAFQMMGVARL